jgi:predicted membrane protein
MFCPKCGAQAEGGKFCRSCGTNLVAVSDALLASDQSRSPSAGGGTTLGIFHEAKLSNAERSLNGHSTASIFGNVKIDLTADDLPAGESHLHIYSIFGAVEVFALNEVGVRITGISLFSSVKVRGTEIGNGVFSGHEYISPGYAQAARRLHIDLASIFSGVKLRR